MSETPEPDDEAIDAMLRTVPTAADEPADPARIVEWHQRRLAGDAPEGDDGAIAGSAYARDLLAGLAEPLPPALADWAEAAIPRRRRRLWIAAPLALAAAALVAVWLTGPSERPGAYRLARVEGQVADVRGADHAASLVFVAGGTVRLWVVPAADDAIPARHAALFITRSGQLRPVVAAVTAHDGAFRLEAPAGDVFETPGEHTLYVGVAADLGPLEDVSGQAPDAVDGVRFVPVVARYRGAGR